MPAPLDVPLYIPARQAKIRMQKPQSGGKFSVQIPGGVRGGGMIMAKIDSRSRFCAILLWKKNETILVHYVYLYTLHFFWARK